MSELDALLNWAAVEGEYPHPIIPALRERDALHARVEELEAAATDLLGAYRADVDAGLKHIFGIPPGPDPAFAAERLARSVDALSVLLNR